MPRLLQRTLSARVGLLLIGVDALATSSHSHAASLRAEAGYWDYRLSGEVTDNNPLDFERDLGVQTRTHNYQRLRFRVGPNWLPEIELGRHRLDVQGERLVVNNLLSFGNLILLQNETVLDAFADLDDLTLTARYPMSLSPTVTAHAGLTLRNVDGPIEIRDQANGDTEDDALDETFPQLHLALDWAATPALTLKAEGDWIEYGRDRAWQWRVGLDWTWVGGFGISAGYHARHFRVSSRNFDLDAHFDGAQIGVIYRWQ